ncbi:AMP-activated protein kinase, gamma regulatory subunit [Reticulomyxa filosa]|uniref:AMP-activated protein kinase, gamma regulatory subunit n=1 Tax=Reticulomyxa filosa TaxID=46433 RepID=X6MHS4_RETFI|nr:AMP-activated protein kinase, gamma regulatory subunit [Reticulomyxa filosa]|eukprot:ETO13399.1 AMP-activated protein kinase, gamma regulatory subunit [Reticulomyxa filosa]
MRHFKTLQTEDSVLTLLNTLCYGNHVIGITQPKSFKLTGIISQGEAFHQIAHLFSKLKLDVSLRILHSCGFVKSPVVSVPTNLPARYVFLLCIVCVYVCVCCARWLYYEAFKLMGDRNLSGLAVVNANKEIVHNTSSTDIKLWLQHQASLDMTIEGFLTKIRSEDKTKTRSVGFVTLDDTLRVVIDKLIETRYHRIWVVDNSKHPTGVISLTDIFRLVSDEYKPRIQLKSKNYSTNVSQHQSRRSKSIFVIYYSTKNKKLIFLANKYLKFYLWVGDGASQGSAIPFFEKTWGKKSKNKSLKDQVQ